MLLIDVDVCWRFLLCCVGLVGNRCGCSLCQLVLMKSMVQMIIERVRRVVVQQMFMYWYTHYVFVFFISSNCVNVLFMGWIQCFVLSVSYVIAVMKN